MKKIYKPRNIMELIDIILDEHFNKDNYNLNDIDTSLITDMSHLFEGIEEEFDISEWDVSNVKKMNAMFIACPNFNCDISKWNVGKVKNMREMFYCCPSFNQDLSKWDMRNVKDTSCMFGECTSFNQNLSMWDIKGKKHFKMFYNCPIKKEWLPKYSDIYKDNGPLEEKVEE